MTTVVSDSSAMSQGAIDEEQERPTTVGPSFFRVAAGFWRSDRRWVAWGFSAAIFTLVLSNVLVLYGVNAWNGAFFNALEAKKYGDIAKSVFLFLGLVGVGAVINYCLAFSRIGMQIEWRRWLTGHIVTRWLSDRNYYKLSVTAGDHDNAEARMSEDVRVSLEPLVELTIGLINALLTAVTFLGILAYVGGALTIGSGDAAVSVPFAFLWTAILYAIVMSTLIYLVGRRLIGAVEEKNAGEAALRFELTRVRESAESIALIAGEDEERRVVDETLTTALKRWWRIAGLHARITFLTNANAIMLPVVPLLAGAPKYIAGDMSLGQLMQVATAFVQVQLAFNWIMDNFVRIAEWRASANRVIGLIAGMEELDRTLDGEDGSQIVVTEGEGDRIVLSGLSVRRDDGTVVIDEADNVISRGERVMVTGESGTGKSTLIRAIAGLWPWGAGEVVLPANWRTMFAPQTPYLPPGTLRAALSYPAPAEDLSDARANDVLELMGLSHLAERLDEEDRWDKILSGGERQRVAFARILIVAPDLVVMDEATSALDEESQDKVMQALLDAVPDATWISVAHRPSLATFHTRTISLRREPGGVRLVRERSYGILGGKKGIGRVLLDLARLQGMQGPPGNASPEPNRSSRVL